jgi:hypothetical protein
MISGDTDKPVTLKSLVGATVQAAVRTDDLKIGVAD